MAVKEVPECLKKELMMEITDFKTPRTADQKMCLARLIQNLIITEPNTYPTNPDLGVGIETYQFEIGDDLLLGNLRESIRRQIEMYVPKADLIKSMEVYKVRNRNSGVCTIVVSFQVDEPGSDSDFLLVLNQSMTDRKVASQIVF